MHPPKAPKATRPMPSRQSSDALSFHSRLIAQTSRCSFGVGESLVIGGVGGHLSIVFSGDEARVRACGVCGRPAHFANGSGHKIMRRDYGCHFVNSSRRSHRCLPPNLTSLECCKPCSTWTSGKYRMVSVIGIFSHFEFCSTNRGFMITQQIPPSWRKF